MNRGRVKVRIRVKVRVPDGGPVTGEGIAS